MCLAGVRHQIVPNVQAVQATHTVSIYSSHTHTCQCRLNRLNNDGDKTVEPGSNE